MNAAPSFHIRPATLDDIPAIEVLIDQSVRRLQRNDYTQSQIDASLGSVFGVDRQLLHDQTYFVATLANDPCLLVASGGWSYRRTLFGCDALTSRDNATIDPATGFARIRSIFVHPDWARRGLGSLILGHCEAAAQAAGFQRFEMGSTLTGVPLYSLKGYTERSRSSLSLPNGELLPIVVMTKSLTP